MISTIPRKDLRDIVERRCWYCHRVLDEDERTMHTECRDEDSEDRARDLAETERECLG